MNRRDALLPAVALALVLLGAVGTAGAATPGYAVYSVQASYMGTSHSFTVNESVSATPNVGFDKLVLTVMSGNTTFSYSRPINSSLTVSPMLPSITNQTFSYATGSTQVSVSILKNGTSPLQFHGSSYSLTSYSIKAAASSNGTTENVGASLLTFPSGLVYSVRASIPIPSLQGLPSLGAGDSLLTGLNFTNGPGSLGLGAGSILSLAAAPSGSVSLSITLLSTSLPLSSPSPSMSEQAASIGIGAGAVVSVLALGLGVRYRHRHQAQTGPKPEYSVD
jgi:hypothetical protein